MFYWYSPLILSDQTLQYLKKRDILNFEGSIEDLPENSLIIYNPPEKIIKDFIEKDTKESEILNYLEVFINEIKESFKNKNFIYISEWRLQYLPFDIENFEKYFLNSQKENKDISINKNIKVPNYDYFINFLTNEIINYFPIILSLYKDLELKGIIYNSQLDLEIMERLNILSTKDNILFKLINTSKNIFSENLELTKKNISLKEANKKVSLEREEIKLAKKEINTVRKELEEVKIELDVYYNLYRKYKSSSLESVSQIKRFLNLIKEKK